MNSIWIAHHMTQYHHEEPHYFSTREAALAWLHAQYEGRIFGTKSLDYGVELTIMGQYGGRPFSKTFSLTEVAIEDLKS